MDGGGLAGTTDSLSARVGAASAWSPPTPPRFREETYREFCETFVEGEESDDLAQVPAAVIGQDVFEQEKEQGKGQVCSRLRGKQREKQCSRGFVIGDNHGNDNTNDKCDDDDAKTDDDGIELIRSGKGDARAAADMFGGQQSKVLFHNYVEDGTEESDDEAQEQALECVEVTEVEEY